MTILLLGHKNGTLLVASHNFENILITSIASIDGINWSYGELHLLLTKTASTIDHSELSAKFYLRKYKSTQYSGSTPMSCFLLNKPQHQRREQSMDSGDMTISRLCLSNHDTTT